MLTFHTTVTVLLYTVCRYRLTGLYQYLHGATVLYVANVQVTCEHPTVHDTHYCATPTELLFDSLLSILHHSFF